MRILIIGGSGFIGPDVFKYLSEMGHETILFNRGTPKLEGASCVAHIVGDLRRFGDFKDEFKRLDPQVVLEDMFHFSSTDAKTVISTLKGVTKRIVAISGTDVYRAYGKLFGIEPGPVDPVPLTEESPLRQAVFPGMKGYDKLVVEQAIMGDPDMPGTILRLPPVYGPRSVMHRIYFYLKRMDDNRPVILMSRNLANWRWTHGYVENMAAAIAQAATDERATGRIYNLGETESTSMIEWVVNIGKAVGWDGEVVISPPNRLVEITPFALMRINAAQDIIVDSTLIRRELGYTEPVSSEAALDRTIDWERSNPISAYYMGPQFFDYETEDAILFRTGSEDKTYH